MITSLQIKNFKSVNDLTLKPGRVNVLIGENGSGKSNVLEAIAFASAAVDEKLDNEFLASRGIRVTDPHWMRSAFSRADLSEPIEMVVEGSGDFRFRALLREEGEAPYSRWKNAGGPNLRFPPGLSSLLKQWKSANQEEEQGQLWKQLLPMVEGAWEQNLARTGLSEFLVYSPENSALRTFEREGQILPLGIRGEGLFKLLKVLSGEEHRSRLEDIKDNLKLIDWYQDFRTPSGLVSYEQALEIGDRFLEPALGWFDQRSANEGFLFLLFYFALFVSSDTPSIFAIDNVDASLNPKLCSELIKRLAVLASRYDKQVIMTTHNPAVLDGLDLNDDEQRLFVVYRNSKGYTRARRISAPQPIAGEPPVRLSEAFMRGLLGGLPQNF